MPEIYHIKIKKKYVAELINDLIKINAVETIEPEKTELLQWQKDTLENEIQSINNNPDYLIPWDEAKHRFNQP